MGSPPTDLECFDFDDELLHKRVIPRRFAIATKEVTVEAIQAVLPNRPAPTTTTAAENDVEKFSPYLSWTDDRCDLVSCCRLLQLAEQARTNSERRVVLYSQ